MQTQVFHGYVARPSSADLGPAISKVMIEVPHLNPLSFSSLSAIFLPFTFLSKVSPPQWFPGSGLPTVSQVVGFRLRVVFGCSFYKTRPSTLTFRVRVTARSRSSFRGEMRRCSLALHGGRRANDGGLVRGLIHLFSSLFGSTLGVRSCLVGLHPFVS